MYINLGLRYIPFEENAKVRGISASDLAKIYGLSLKDLEPFSLGATTEQGRALVNLFPETGEIGAAKASLTHAYGCEIRFQDVREPYLIVRGRLFERATDKTLLENTVYLEKDKPALLGLTNLREALILILKLHDPLEGASPAPKGGGDSDPATSPKENASSMPARR